MKCQLIVIKKRCEVCRHYLITVSAMEKSRLSASDGTSSSHRPNKSLNLEQMKIKLFVSAKEKHCLQSQLKKLKERLKQEMDTNSILLSGEDSQPKQGILSNNKDQLKQLSSESSPMKI